MKIFNSIKWRLQIWYGLILVATIAIGIAEDCQMERERQLAEVDRALHVQFQNLMSALHLPPPRPFDDFSPPPPERRMPDSPSGFHLQEEAVTSFFENIGAANYYCAIWLADGRKFMASTNAPQDIALPIDFLTRDGPLAQTRGANREIIFRVRMPDYNIIIGRPMTAELQELRRYDFKQFTNGVMILIFSLAIGVWLVSRSLKPIKNISAAAVKISAGDLSQRINVAEAESELGQLAAVLNSTFARLESAFAQQKQFASDAAHELRTPVSVILTQTQTALNRERDAASYKETVEACQRAAQRMRKLIKSLLELARLDAGQEKLKRLQIDFSKTVEDCVELIRPIAEERGVKIISELEPLEISGDSERLAQVVTNLLTNAIQYNRDGGEVRVSLKIKNGFAALKISDTGLGISAEDLPNVFKRFFRGDKSRTGAANAGLGLAITKAIVEAHGGTIEVASKEDVGTTFRVKLPV
jgi:two-component system, OmpR family, sensor kinase